MSDSEEDSVAQQIKIVFVGEPNVGKTNIIRRFCYDDFFRHHSPTMGADFYLKQITFPGRKKFLLKLTDIGGLELKGHMLDMYLFKADMIILVYDITNKNSFEAICVWMDTISNLIISPPFSAAIGNKCDLEHQRAVRLDRTNQVIEEFGFCNYLASAKTGELVNSCIVELIANYVGVPITRSQRELQQPVIKLELSAATHEHTVRKKKFHVHPTKTSACRIQ